MYQVLWQYAFQLPITESYILSKSQPLTLPWNLGSHGYTNIENKTDKMLSSLLWGEKHEQLHVECESERIKLESVCNGLRVTLPDPTLICEKCVIKGGF